LEMRRLVEEQPDQVWAAPIVRNAACHASVSPDAGRCFGRLSLAASIGRSPYTGTLLYRSDPVISSARLSPAAGAAALAQAELGDLPEWDLADLYPGRDSPALTKDLAAADGAAKEFRGRYQGKLATLSGNALAAAIEAYEALDETLSRIMSFADLTF